VEKISENVCPKTVNTLDQKDTATYFIPTEIPDTR
jgi:hypothetical protein